MSEIRELLKNKRTFSIEILPPQLGSGCKETYEYVEKVLRHPIDFINITTHPETGVIDFSTEPPTVQSVRRRPGTIAISSYIKHNFKIPVCPHILATGFTEAETEYALIDLNYLGINDIFLVRGDLDRYILNQQPLKRHTLDLIKQVRDLNEGRFRVGSVESVGLNMSFGVACYPEKHMESPNMEDDLKFLDQKMCMGASYAITQMVFDLKVLSKFIKQIRERVFSDIKVIVGLKAITNLRTYKSIPKTFGVTYPLCLYRAMEQAKTDAEARKIGTDFIVEQINTLEGMNISGIHVFTNSKESILDDLFKYCNLSK